MYTFWDFPFISYFWQLHFQGLPCYLYTLGTSPFIFKDFLVCVHFLGLPIFIKLSTTSFSRTSLFVYALGTSPLQLTTSTFHFQGLPWFLYTLGAFPFIFKDFLVVYILWGLPLSFSRTSLFVYTCWDFPLQSNFQQLHFQGLPCLYILWGLPFFFTQITTISFARTSLFCIYFGDFPFTINNFYVAFSRTSLFWDSPF